jgi:hypothetical protein
LKQFWLQQNLLLVNSTEAKNKNLKTTPHFLLGGFN